MALISSPPASDCTDCCDCPQVLIEFASRAKVKSKSGFVEFIPSDPAAIYVTATLSGGEPNDEYPNAFTLGGEITFSKSTGLVESNTTSINILKAGGGRCTVYPFWTLANGFIILSDTPGSWVQTLGRMYPFTTDDCATLGRNYASSATPVVGDAVTGSTPTAITGYAQSITVALSNEYTTGELIANASADLFGTSYGAWSDPAPVAGGVSGVGFLLAAGALTADELTASLIQKKFRVRHLISKVGRGCYRVVWEKVSIPAVLGPGIDSLTSDKPLGGFVPGSVHAVTISAPDTGTNTAGYVQAAATATANAEGVLEFALTESGAGYGPSGGLSAEVEGIALRIHLVGAEAGGYSYAGPKPGGYNPATPSTYPTSTEEETELPAITEPEGDEPPAVVSIYLMNVQAFCKGCGA